MTNARQAIADGYRAFELAFHNGDADAISQMYTEDAAASLVPGGNTVRVKIGEVQERRVGVRGRQLCRQRAGRSRPSRW